MDKTDNEILAEFLGMTLGVCHGQKGAYRSETDFISIHTLESYAIFWDWLMPVWYKFRDLHFPNRNDIVFAVIHKGRIQKAILNEGIESSFKALVEAIKWYNSLKK